MINSIVQGDCLEVMKDIPDGSIDAVITDPPYGTTACGWDSIIPFNKHIMMPKSKRSKKLTPVYRDEYILRELQDGRSYNDICKYFDEYAEDGMWEQLKRVTKKNGAIVLFGSQPFTSALVMSNPKMFKYEWVWEKNRGSNFATTKYQPMKEHENILVFGEGRTSYYPIKQLRAEGGLARSKYDVNASNTGKRDGYGGIKGVDSGKIGKLRVPRSIQKFNTEVGYHPTQKPVALMEYLIKTYTSENEVVLDFCIGSGTTGVACRNLDRDFIGIELDPAYFKIAEARINETR